MTNFSDILNRSIDEVDEPKPVPVGTWRLQIISAKAEPGKTTQNGDEISPAILITLKPVEPGPDVSEAELEVAGDVSGERIFHRMYVKDRRDEWNVKKFLMAAGVEGGSWDEMFAAAKGQYVMGYVSHKPNPNDPEKPYVNAGQFAAVE